MNCSSAIPKAEDGGVNLQSVTMITFLLLSELFLLLCAYPVFKLARERIALYIFASKVNNPRASQHSLRHYGPVVGGLPPPQQFAQLRPSCLSHKLWRVQLAQHPLAHHCVGCRAHALFFPFHYSQKMTKRIIFAQCVLMHLLAIVLTPFYASTLGRMSLFRPHFTRQLHYDRHGLSDIIEGGIMPTATHRRTKTVCASLAHASQFKWWPCVMSRTLPPPTPNVRYPWERNGAKSVNVEKDAVISAIYRGRANRPFLAYLRAIACRLPEPI
uniref:Uncharacterized protein n=1 Tax=Globodera rostochiensis TaxID=31243 RepID=A0A914HSF8_GLORO